MLQKPPTKDRDSIAKNARELFYLSPSSITSLIMLMEGFFKHNSVWQNWLAQTILGTIHKLHLAGFRHLSPILFINVTQFFNFLTLPPTLKT